MPDTHIATLADEQFISLTTFRRDGRAVATPLWFVLDGDQLLIWTGPRSGKVKRLRNNPKVTVAPSTRRGKPTGPAFDATARFLPEVEFPRATRLMNKKYGFAKRLIDAFGALSRTVRRKRDAGNIFLAVTPA
ncbi:MAG: PPOX class F420-dependent oxidoreductase [Chloroflexota bacterium]|nr:PPOX class F420-dependent oxidoreductase [Chloroflexota bacterium]